MTMLYNENGDSALGASPHDAAWTTGNQDAQEASVWKGAVAGGLGGAAGTWVMEQFQTKMMPRVARRLGETEEAAPGQDEDLQEDPATVKAAAAVSERVLGRELPEDAKPVAGEAAHYAMGVTSGIVLGVAAEHMPSVTMGRGAAFGTAVWAVADEAAVPALGLSGSPFETPPKTHLYALASHVVYGVTTEAVRRGIRRMLRFA